MGKWFVIWDDTTKVLGAASSFRRQWIRDFFSSPFWDSIPDKPFDTLGSEFTVSAGELRIAGIDASKITSGVLDAARIPGLDASKIVSGRFSLSRLPTSSTANRFLVVRTANADPVFDTLKASDIPNLDASKITSGVFDVARIPDLLRSKITDFFSPPFWNNIPDKPSTFPPEAHHSTHQLGGSDEIPSNDILLRLQKHRGVWWFNNNWLPAGMLVNMVAGSASISWSTDCVELKTGATAGSIAMIIKAARGLTGAASWDKKRHFGVRVYFSSVTGLRIHIVTGTIYDPTSGGNTERHVGFKLINGDLYGTVGDGAAESTLLLETLTSAGYKTLECVFTPGSKCEFYVDGVYKGDITTNLPSGTDYAFDLLTASINNTAAENKILRVYEVRVLQEE